MHTLAYKDRYLNDSITFLSNTIIKEYDMKDAGLSLIQEYSLLPDKKIKELIELNQKKNDIDNKYGKKLATVKIGKYQRDNDKVNQGMKLGFIECRDKFITENGLDEMSIISIKKDAIFVRKQVKNTKFGKYIHFRCKNTYNGYLLINKIEIYYYNKGFDNDGLDIKNLGEAGEEFHKNFFLKFIIRFFRKTQSSNKEEVLNFLILFIDKYKALELDQEYYKEFKSNGKYLYKDGVVSGTEFRQNKEELDISYNYKILLDLVKVVI